MRKKVFQILPFLLFLTTYNFSQEYIVKFTHLSTGEGLSSGLINNFFEDSRGFVWLTMKDGLNRFDGKSFKFFFTEEDLVHSNYCTYAVEDVDGNIWTYFMNKRGDIGHAKGQFHYLLDKNFNKRVIDDYLGKKMPFKSIDIKSIYQHYDRTLFIQTYSNELYKYDGVFQKITDLPKSDYLHVSNVNQKGDIFVFNWTNRLKFDKKGNKIESQNFTEPIDYNNALYNLKVGNIPYLNMRGGFEQLQYFFDYPKLWEGRSNGNSLLFQRLKAGEKSYIVNHGYNQLILFDKDAKLIYDFSNHLKETFGDINVQRRILLRKNQIWFNTIDGVYIMNYKPNPFKSHFKKNTHFSTRGITKLADGNLLAATHNRIEIENLNTKSRNTYDFNQRTHLWGSVAKSKNEVLFGSYFPHIHCYDISTNQTRKIELTAKDKAWYHRKNFFVPFIDKSEKIWIGTQTGLITYNSDLDSLEVFQNYNEFEELKTESINHFEEGKEGIWLATSNGLYLLDSVKGIIQSFKLKLVSPIHHFHREGNTFWLATYGDGLVKWNMETKETQKFGLNNGFLNQYLTAIYPDNNDFFWIATETGLIQFNSKTEEINVFLESDGIAHNEFNRSAHFKDEAGNIYFGGLNGVTAFHPDSILNTRSNNSPFEITDYFEMDENQGIFNNKTSELLTKKSIQLNHSINAFRIHFSLLNFNNVDKTQYAYKIEGLDKDWNMQKENFIRINQLSYGNYTLKIKAKDYSGKWNKHELVIPIEVITPYYAQLKWQLTAFGLFSFFIFLIYKWRIFLLEKKQEHLENIVKERTQIVEAQKKELVGLNETKDRLFSILAHDLRDPVLAFKGISKKIIYLLKRKEAKRVIDFGVYIEKEAQYLHDLLDNLLNWTLTQRNEVKAIITTLPLFEIVENMVKNNQHLMEISSISLHNQIPKNILVMADRPILKTVLRNLISNAFRYTKEGDWIKISAKSVGDNIEIIIQDNGIGMNESQLKSLFKITVNERQKDRDKNISLGLHLCRELIELLNGKIEASSEVEVGTSFIITLPVGD